MRAPISFKAQLLNGKIVLSGNLDNSREVRQECERIAKAAVQTQAYWIVDAQQARVPVGGENTWSEVAQEILRHCQLVYLPSPLAQNLEYDDRYKHGNSRFLETDDELAGCSRTGSCCASLVDSAPRRCVLTRIQHEHPGRPGER